MGGGYRLSRDDTERITVHETQGAAREMKEPHIHKLLTYEEAERLCEHYKRQGYSPVKMLNINPKYFDVSVNLPTQKWLKPTPRTMINRMWR